MATDEQAREVAARIATWLRHAFPRNTAKEAAKAFCASQFTTKKWLDGNTAPLNRHILAMIQRWKHPFVTYIFTPLMRDKRSLSEEIVDLEQRLTKLKPRAEAEERNPIDPATYFARHAPPPNPTTPSASSPN